MPEYIPSPEERGKALKAARQALGISRDSVTAVLEAILGYEMPAMGTQVARWEGETNSQLGPIALTALLRVLEPEHGRTLIARAQARIENADTARSVAAQHRRDLAFKRKHMKRARELGITYEELRAILIEEARAAARAEREAGSK